MAEDGFGITTYGCDGTVDEMLRRVVAQIDDLGLEVFAVIDHSGEATDAGLALGDTKLVLFGDPAVATRLILAHSHIALDLPLKLLISERDDGHASLSYDAPTHLVERHGLTVDEAEELRVVETIARATRSTS